MGNLPPKQKKILEYIQKFISSNSFPPTYLEIAVKFNIIVGTVQDHISALIRKGYLEKSPDKARGIKVVNQNENLEISRFKSNIEVIPLYGSVAAGEPIFAEDNIQGYIAYERKKKSLRDIFALKVKGSSMKDAGIYDDDIVIVKKQDDCEDGEIIIALLDDEATVKTLRKRKTGAYLEPANVKFKPISGKVFQILGKVIELRRKYQIL
ncbi:MAG: transcriptional repressor LexA [Ignavibacteria bacterium]|jgi:repressor LexA